MTITFVIFASPSFAHNPDTSYLRCRVAPNDLELRFTFDPATIYRIVHPDADGDGKTTRAEMEAAAADVYDYLEASVRLEVNGKPVELGQRAGLGWPAEAGDAIAEKDYHTQMLHFTFQCPSRSLIEDFYVCYDVFAELGDGHRVMADIQQGERHQEVEFSLFEPDYLYDTFSSPAVKDLFRQWVAVAWGSPFLFLALVPPFILGAFRFSRKLALLAAAPGLTALLWQLRGELQPVSWLMPVSGIAVATILGAIILLPLFLCLTPGRQVRSGKNKTAPPEQAQQRSG